MIGFEKSIMLVMLVGVCMIGEALCDSVSGVRNKNDHRICWGHFERQSQESLQLNNAVGNNAFIRLNINWKGHNVLEYYLGRQISRIEYKARHEGVKLVATCDQLTIHYQFNQSIQVELSSSVTLNGSASTCKELSKAQSSNSYSCQRKGKIVIGQSLPKSFGRAESLGAIEEFLKTHKLNSTYEPLGKYVFTNTLGSICSQQGEYANSYYALCHHNQFELRESLLIIDNLFHFDPHLACWLFENYLDFIEEKMFYPNKYSLEWVPAPEHISVALSYLARITKIYNERDLSVAVRKLNSILNGFITQFLLIDINHLADEINYRETKQLHPTIIKMLSLDWKGASAKKARNSVYEESFSPDFLYHTSQEHLDSCIGKTITLLRLVRHSLTIQLETASGAQRNSNQQLITLSNLLVNFINEGAQNPTKEHYFPIIKPKLEGSKVYSKIFGYQSFLPYIEKVTSQLPKQALANLTTQYGLSSFWSDQAQSDSSYDFRGNCHLYYNYQLLRALHKRVKIQPLRAAIAALIKNVQNTVLKHFDEGKLYAVWDQNGKGKNEKPQLSLLALLILSPES